VNSGIVNKFKWPTVCGRICAHVKRNCELPLPVPSWRIPKMSASIAPYGTRGIAQDLVIVGPISRDIGSASTSVIHYFVSSDQQTHMLSFSQFIFVYSFFRLPQFYCAANRIFGAHAD
jgi:hypothetical protein